MRADSAVGCSPCRPVVKRAAAGLSSVPDVREERIETDGVPATLYNPGDATALLLLGHGGGYSKDAERFVHLSRQYAERTSLAVVCLDAVDHGERQPVGADPNVHRGWHSDTASRMVQDWRKTVDALSAVGPARAIRVSSGLRLSRIVGGSLLHVAEMIGAALFFFGYLNGLYMRRQRW